MKTALNVKVTL